ncbi:MAG TPA: thioredoxin-dependent thiol peroxidase [Candidatus Rifleibacterium sp.]|nr:thioredoxin-dependent thiol peroxidase [Candidatus Rifleibacterium sp.]
MNGAELKGGDKAPTFDLLDQDGTRHSLADYAGKKILLYFYPKASTPGCTTQACSLRDAFAELQAMNVVVVGVSPDQPDALKKFAEEQSLNFVLLSDPEKKVAGSYGVAENKAVFGLISFGITRSSFLISEDGKIIDAWYKVKPDQTAPLAIECLKNLK